MFCISSPLGVSRVYWLGKTEKAYLNKLEKSVYKVERATCHNIHNVVWTTKHPFSITQIIET